MAEEVSAPSTNTAPVTVVIATRDRPQLLEAALAAVNRARRPGDSVVVVDSASRDAVAIKQLAADAGATLVRCDDPGASRARNAGWQAATTDVVAFTDDDCLPHDNWIQALRDALERTPSASFVTGRVEALATGSQRARLHLAVTSREEPARFDSPDEAADIGHGANMAWRKRVLEDLGGFDEGLGPGTPLRAAEDVDLFWRLLIGGASGVFEPGATVDHRQWRSRAQHLRVYYGYGVGSGALAVKRWRLERGAECPQQAPLSWRFVARRARRDIVWRRLVHGIARNVSHRYAMGVMAELAMFVGEVRGVIRARSLPVRDGCFRSSG